MVDGVADLGREGEEGEGAEGGRGLLRSDWHAVDWALHDGLLCHSSQSCMSGMSGDSDWRQWATPHELGAPGRVVAVQSA